MEPISTMSSLAAALAASKQLQLIGAKSTEFIDTEADSSLEANSNIIHLKPPHSSRLSSLQQQCNQRNKEVGQLEGKIQKQQIIYNDNRTENEHEKPLPTHNEATNARRRRGTKKGTNDDPTSSLLATANGDVPKSSEIVFLCDVPSDDGNTDGYYHDGETKNRRLVKSKNSRRKKWRGRNKGIIEDGHGGIAAATTGVGEIVFVCDIPSSSDSINDEDDDRECGAVNNDSHNNNNNSRHHHEKHGRNRDRGNNGGQSRSDRDNPLNNPVRSVSRGGRGNDQRQHSNTSQNHAAKHEDNNPGIKPTPWSAKAREMAKNDTGNNSKQYNRTGPPPQAAMPTRWSSRAKSNTSSSSSRAKNNQGFVNVVPTRCTDTSNQTLPATTDTTENELTTAAPLKLKSTIIKGRWADVDSDDSD